jgi:hypothetical protein
VVVTISGLIYNIGTFNPIIATLSSSSLPGDQTLQRADFCQPYFPPDAAPAL